MTLTSITLPLVQRSLAFTASPTFAEFLELVPELAWPIHTRLREVRIPLECQDFFVGYPYVLHLILLLDVESPETVVVAPVLVAIGRCSPRFSLHVCRENDDLHMLDRLVDDLDLAGGTSEPDLPLLLIFDEEWNYQGQWGPHPQAAESYLEEWFERYPHYDELAATDTPEAQAKFAALLEQLTHEMRVWYNSGLNAACIYEIKSLLSGLLDEESAEDEEAA